MKTDSEVQLRDLKTLYGLVLNLFTEQGGYLCLTIGKLFKNKTINFKELVLLRRHFKSQYPTKKLHTEFFNHYLFNNDKNKQGSWFLGIVAPIEGKQVRIDFINKIISTL